MKLLRQLGMSIDTIRSFQQGSAGFALVLAELAARPPARLTGTSDPALFGRLSAMME